MNAQTAQSRPAESYDLFDGFIRYGNGNPDCPDNRIPSPQHSPAGYESLSFFPSLYRVEYEIRRPGPSETGLRGPRLQQGQRGDGFHQNFIETVWSAAHKQFPEAIDQPEIRVSHIVKGRIPEAIHKPVGQLLESDKTIYYERMMFCFEIPSVYEEIEGNRLNLSVGGVRAYNHENLYSKKTAEKFRVFIGFKNLVCCNLWRLDGRISKRTASHERAGFVRCDRCVCFCLTMPNAM